MRPKLFIGSSSEGLDVARAVEVQLERDAEVTVWSDGVFGLGRGTLESLVLSLDKFDFAVLVLTPDDMTVSREVSSQSPRDNILLELGLFIGRLGRERTFIIYNRDRRLKLPSDLAGVSMADFGDREDDNLIASLGAACTKIKYQIKSLGTFGRSGTHGGKPDAGGFGRPVVTARVATHAGGNVSIALDLVVHNTGGSPAKNVRLAAERSELEAAFSEDVDPKWKSQIERCFSVEGMIPVLEDGQNASVTNSFGVLSADPKYATWKVSSILNVKISYQDLDGRPYAHDIPLKIADDAGFAGSYWEDSE